MKSLRHLLLTALCSGALVLGTLQSQAATVTVDPSQNWLGYMNVFNSPSAGGGYLWGSPWGAADLPATFSGTALTLGPNVNTYAVGDLYWVNPDGSGNKQLSANFYVETPSLAGSAFSFTGEVLANTLVSSYTTVAFVKEFAPGYALVGQTTAPLVGGSPFSIDYTGTAGNIIQYGFETFGLNANPATVSELGSVQIAVVPEPTAIGLLVAGVATLAAFRRKN